VAEDNKPNLHVTPLVDVVLVLLIIFMAVTPLMMKKLTVHLPETVKTDTPPALDQTQLLFRVEADGRIFANATEIPRDAIEETISRMVAARADRTVFVDAADDAKYGLAVRVMDAARGAGATTVGILTETAK
jgi:biopolymer transport protein ExbD